MGETGLDYFPDSRHRTSSVGCSTRRSPLRTSSGSPSSSTTARPTRRRWTALAGFAGTVVLHCFSSPALVALATDRSYYVSFAGNVTYPNAEGLREAASAIRSDRILVETDSPYLAPQPVRGTRNEPANLVHTLQALAEARGESLAELAARTHANATTAFGLT